MKPLPANPGDKHRFFGLAALFEGAFSFDWLIELTGQKPSQVLSLLEEGVAQGWLVRQQPGFFSFQDPKLQKAWGERLSPQEKSALHRRIGDILLKESPDDLQNAEAAARHLIHLPNNLNGCQWLVKAANKMQRAYAFSEALSYYGKVLEDLSVLPGEDAAALFVDTALRYAKIAIARVDSEKVGNILEQAVARCASPEMRPQLSQVKMHLAKNEWLQSKYSSALAHFEEGWKLIKDIHDSKTVLSATAFRIFSLFWQGHLKEAVRLYEESVPAIEKFPKGGLPIVATGVVGYCYAQIGQLTQGLGMLNAIKKHCLNKGVHFLAADVEVTIGGLMVHLRRADEALSYLGKYIAPVKESDWNLIRGKLFLSFALFLKGKKKEAARQFEEWLGFSRAVHVTALTNPFWFELSKAMEEGKFPRIGGISLKEEVSRYLEDENILMKGLAYRYRAFLQEREAQKPERIIKSLRLSVKYLEDSGDTFELCRTYRELMRQYSLIGREKMTQEIGRNIGELLGSSNPALVPDDLQFILKKLPQREEESLCKEILNLSQDISTMRDQKQLLQAILSTANRITGAERGAIFTVEKGAGGVQIWLKASKNITSGQVAHASFEPAMRLIKTVAEKCEGYIDRNSSPEPPGCAGSERILSRICVPMVIRNKVVGVLYHDNSLFLNSFKKRDLELLSYFATQAAIAMDHAAAYEEIQRLNQRLNQEKQYLEEQHLQNFRFDDIVGESPAILEVLNKIDQVAKTEANVLILGETGVGKDLVARAIHRHSSRSSEPFIKVLCSALPETLIPSELFGHEKGAFTGSIQRRIGRFELADGGTLFLDEIGELPLDIQTRLLQVLQSKEFERVGGNETIRSDFRLVTATNRDLAAAVKAQRFRSDLYYRLNVFPIYVPPLRERKEDIPRLTYHFLKNYATRMGKTFDGIPREEMEKLAQYNWPGNIRELENIIERATILSADGHFRLPDLGMGPRLEPAGQTADSTLEEIERAHILRILEKTGWKVRGRGGAAEILNLHYSTLFFRMKKLGVRRPSDGANGRRERRETV